MAATPKTARCLVLAIVLLATAPSVGATAEEPAARVVAITGAANILRGDAPQAVGPGMALHAEDQVVTGADSRVQIEFADGSSVTLGASTILSVSAFAASSAPDPGRAALDLITGIVRLVTRGTQDSFELRTRSAVASVRGTSWIVESEPDRDSVFVIEGRVRVAGRRAPGSVTLEAGEGTDVALGEPPAPASVWGAPRVEDVMARTRAP